MCVMDTLIEIKPLFLIDFGSFTDNTEAAWRCRDGAILDSFMNSTDMRRFACDQGSVPVGFSASSSCFAVTNFQVISQPLVKPALHHFETFEGLL